MQYVLLVHGRARPDPTRDAVDEVPAWAAAFVRLCRDKGVCVAGDLLAPDFCATTVSYGAGRPDFIDGPVAPKSPHLDACFTVDCPHLDALLALLRQVPVAARGSIEIRPVDPLSQRMWSAT